MFKVLHLIRMINLCASSSSDYKRSDNSLPHGLNAVSQIEHYGLLCNGFHAEHYEITTVESQAEVKFVERAVV